MESDYCTKTKINGCTIFSIFFFRVTNDESIKINKTLFEAEVCSEQGDTLDLYMRGLEARSGNL